MHRLWPGYERQWAAADARAVSARRFKRDETRCALAKFVVRLQT